MIVFKQQLNLEQGQGPIPSGVISDATTRLYVRQGFYLMNRPESIQKVERAWIRSFGPVDEHRSWANDRFKTGLGTTPFG